MKRLCIWRIDLYPALTWGNSLIQHIRFSKIRKVINCFKARFKMRNKASRVKYTLLLLFIFQYGIVAGQKVQPSTYKIQQTNTNAATRVCGTDMLLNNLRINGNFKAKEDSINQQILSISGSLGDSSFMLPVVFHIINPNPATITNAQIVILLNNLNDAFGKKGAYIASKGADTKIQFCLARKDPDGGNTTGITRTSSSFGIHFNPDIADEKLKNLNRWDPSKYINIWIVENIDKEISANFQCGVWSRLGEGGYATFPGSSMLSDGIVISGVSPGPMLPHEMGHYLSLYHTFEGLNCANSNCSTEGDRVCDTPPDASIGNSPSCNSPQNSCSTDTLSNHSNGFFLNDVPDLISDFMDYGNDGCHNEFTEGQAERMRAAIKTQRSGLLLNECNLPCAENITANFSRDNAQPVMGGVINFTNNSSGAGNYQWLVNNVVVSTSTNYSTSFSAAGSYKVTLKAFNSDANCFAAFTDFIIVTCGVTANFYTNKRTIASKFPVSTDSIYFANTSVNATAYQWMITFNGSTESVASTTANLNYVFMEPGNYTFRLIAINGTCSDTTISYPVFVADATQDGALFINNVECYQQTKVRLNFLVCNYGYATIPANIPISFYDADPSIAGAHKIGATFFLPNAIVGNCCYFGYTVVVDAGKPASNQLYAVFNDSGKTTPLVLPGTGMQELNYVNNITFAKDFQFKIAAVPATATMLPGDTLQLSETVLPPQANNSSFVWSTSQNMSCTNCANPFFIAPQKISTIKKLLVATSSLGCFDSSYVEIKIPPYNDFTITIDSIACAGKDSMFTGFTICNKFTKGSIPKGIKVSFYDGDPSLAAVNSLAKPFATKTANAANCVSFKSFIKRSNTGKVFAVVNDNGTSIPLTLPNDTSFIESNYLNNTASINYSPFTASITPATATLEPGDTLQLNGSGQPDSVFSFLWSTSQGLSCTTCQNPVLIAPKKTIIKKLIATNGYGCYDTSTITILVPPADDYTVTINSIDCSKNDSLFLNFSVCNSFKRGIIPKGLQVAFYDADPSTANAHLLGPVFINSADKIAKCATYAFTIKGISGGTIYAVVNNNGMVIPVIFPYDTTYLEKNYTNNISNFAYQPATVSLQPSDTTIFRKQRIPLTINTIVYDPSSTTWFTGDGYSLSCTNCLSPVVTVLSNSLVSMQTANQYGCLIKGVAKINIFPPDITVQILETSCFTNSTTRVKFVICMNNGYDSVLKSLPVSFYNGNPLSGNANLLSPTFYTQKISTSACDTFVHVVQSPDNGRLYAVVNDKGGNKAVIPDKAFEETNYVNDTTSRIAQKFVVTVSPADTIVFRNSIIQLSAASTGGIMTSYLWQPTDFLSCSNCPAPFITPPYSMQYKFIANNEYACIDTVEVNVKTIVGGKVDIPAAFSPNEDGHNDIFYILGGREISRIKDFSIYTRWGDKVFQVANVPANTPAYGWNGYVKGNPAMPGTYVYFVSIVFTDGKVQFYKGTVVLIR